MLGPRPTDSINEALPATGLNEIGHKCEVGQAKAQNTFIQLKTQVSKNFDPSSSSVFVAPSSPAIEDTAMVSYIAPPILDDRSHARERSRFPRVRDRTAMSSSTSVPRVDNQSNKIALLKKAKILTYSTPQLSISFEANVLSIVGSPTNVNDDRVDANIKIHEMAKNIGKSTGRKLGKKKVDHSAPYCSSTSHNEYKESLIQSILDVDPPFAKLIIDAIINCDEEGDTEALRRSARLMYGKTKPWLGDDMGSVKLNKAPGSVSSINGMDYVCMANDSGYLMLDDSGRVLARIMDKNGGLGN